MAINTFKSHVRRVVGQSNGRSAKERKLKRAALYDNDKNNYGTTYTERQLRILSGELPWEVVPQHEICLNVAISSRSHRFSLIIESSATKSSSVIFRNSLLSSSK